MQIYVLDEFLGRTAIIDKFESFIWTERYSTLGDFTLVIEDTSVNRSLLRDATYLTHSLTDRIMVVETRLRETDEAGVRTLKVSGPGFESLLANRAVYPRNEGDTTWTAKETHGWVATRLVADHMINGVGTPYDILAGLYVADTTGGTEQVEIASALSDSLLTAVQKICDSAKLGFRIQLLSTDPRYRFNVYKGRDLRHVVFSSSLDTLTQESHLHDIKGYKNIARVRGKDSKVIVLVPAPGTSVYRTNWMRKVLDVAAEDIDPTKVTAEVYRDQLKQRGLEALAQTNRVDIFDAQFTGLDPFDYRYSYSLGDIVTMMTAEGRMIPAIITEYIWAWDAEGLRSYPTFTATDEWN